MCFMHSEAGSDHVDTATQLILRPLAVLVIALAEVAVVTGVAVAPSAHTVPSTLALHAHVSAAGVP